MTFTRARFPALALNDKRIERGVNRALRESNTKSLRKVIAELHWKAKLHRALKRAGGKTKMKAPERAPYNEPGTLSANEFRALRLLAGLSQTQLANLLRSKLQNVKRYEKGTHKVPESLGLLVRITCDPVARAEWQRSVEHLIITARKPKK